jgi:hypothetical protein
MSERNYGLTRRQLAHLYGQLEEPTSIVAPRRDRTSAIALCLFAALLAIGLALIGYVSDGGLLP